MKKQNIYQKARASKLVVTSFWIFFGFLFFGDFVVANTVISNAGNSIFSSNIVMDDGKLISSGEFNNIYYVSNITEFNDVEDCSNCKIVVEDGDYELDSYTIQFENEKNIILDLGNANFYLSGSSNIIFNFDNVSNLRIIGGNFYSNKAGKPIRLLNRKDSEMKNIYIEKANFYDWRDDTISISSLNESAKISNVHITKNNFYNCSSAVSIGNLGTPLGSANEVYIQNNVFDGENEDMGYVKVISMSKSHLTLPVEHIFIDNNIFKNYYTNSSVVGIYIASNSSTKDIKIRNNVFVNLTADGNYSAYGVYASDVDEIFFTDNYCNTIGYTGSGDYESHCILISGSDLNPYGKGAHIVNNFIKNIFTGAMGLSASQDSEGIYCKSYYCIMEGNNLIDGGDSRSIVSKGSHGGSSTIISGNTVRYEDRYPLNGYISGSTSNSTIEGNIIHGKTSINAPAIELANNRSMTFTVKNNYGYGISEAIGNYGTIYTQNEVYLEGNVFFGSATKIIDESMFKIMSNEDNYLNGILYGDSSAGVSSEGKLLDMNFNSGSINGNTVLDSSGNNNHGINSGAIFSSNIGHNNDGSFYFNDGTDKIDLNTNFDFGLDTNFTFSIWVYAESSEDKEIFGRYDGSNQILQLEIKNNNFQFQYGDVAGTRKYVTTPITLNTWKHLAVSFDGTQVKLYENGILVDTETNLPSEFRDSTEIHLGERGGSAYSSFLGYISQFTVYNRSLSGDEIRKLYKQKIEPINSYVSQKDIQISIDGNATAKNIAPLTNNIYSFGSSVLRWLKGWFVNIDVSEKVYLNGVDHYIHFNGTCIVAVGTGQTGACL